MSTDILTQLQTTYTQLLTQFYSTLSYLSQRHPLDAPEPIAEEPFTNKSIAPADPGPEDADATRYPFPLRPESPTSFQAAQKELADDLVLKAQQIHQLIANLPGLGKGEEEQADSIRQMVGQVEEMEKEKKEKRRELRQLVKRLESVIGGMGRSIQDVNGHSDSLNAR